MTLKPWHFFAVAIAGWMNRQQEVIEYLKVENRILREKLGHKRLILNDSQKRCLANAGMKLGKDLLRQFGTLFSPDTILRWQRQLIARKYNGCGGKRGPVPKKANLVRKLVLEMAESNPTWGYNRINGELKKLGYKVHWQTGRRILLDAGLLPDPDKPYKTTWKTFLASHWESIAATDFFSVELWGLKGLTRYMVFFVIDLAGRKVEIAGIHCDPCEIQMIQWARNLTDAQDGFLKDKRILSHDRDPLFTQTFRETLGAAGVRALRLPKRSPNLNPVAESFARNIKREALDKIILFSEKQLRYVVSQYMDHYHFERPHSGLDNRRITEPETPPLADGPILCRERLGGLLKSYYRQAA